MLKKLLAETLKYAAVRLIAIASVLVIIKLELVDGALVLPMIKAAFGV